MRMINDKWMIRGKERFVARRFSSEEESQPAKAQSRGNDGREPNCHSKFSSFHYGTTFVEYGPSIKSSSTATTTSSTTSMEEINARENTKQYDLLGNFE